MCQTKARSSQSSSSTKYSQSDFCIVPGGRYDFFSIGVFANVKLIQYIFRDDAHSLGREDYDTLRKILGIGFERWTEVAPQMIGRIVSAQQVRLTAVIFSPSSNWRIVAFSSSSLGSRSGFVVAAAGPEVDWRAPCHSIQNIVLN